MVSVHATTIRYWVIGAGIPLRTQSESQRIQYAMGRRKPPWLGKRGEENPNFKGGRRLKADGYIQIYQPNHHRATSQGYILEHILIWERVHGKQLPKDWVIHHLNGIKGDNRPENLVAMSRKKHYIVLRAKAQRIRELEAKVRLLEKTLDNSQMVFFMGEN